ncbi:MAG: DUF4419 domain-containing protein [Crocinitomicaceae bacterium]|nr:DUF4419 domain-containing protein [Crocinitomicaceae bacterium]MBK8927901.1 DUF4419 domain-containing protein [Crocinitomicaceae bacterium]
MLIISAAMALMAFGLIEIAEAEKSNGKSTENYSAKIKTNLKQLTNKNIEVSHELPDTITFQVADVEPATSLLKTDEAQKIFESKIGKEIIYMPDEHQDSLVYAQGNVFIQTLHRAFDEHRPLMLSPDIIWLTICQGVAIHINEKIDSLEDVIFIKQKPNELVVRNDSLLVDNAQWANVLTSLQYEVEKYMKKEYGDFFVPQFSTTTAATKTVYRITALHSFKEVFTYISESGCGIPSISLTGTRNDWVRVQNNLKYLSDFGMDFWRIELEPIIQEFIHVYDGKINVDFWNRIYKDMEEYGGMFISGWCLKLFPYTEGLEFSEKFSEEDEYPKGERKYYRNKYLQGTDYLLSNLSTDDLPSGILDITIIWKNYFQNITEPMHIYGGFFAIKQHDDFTLEPMISWAVCKDKARETEHEMVWNSTIVNKHDINYWAPFILSKVDHAPIFHPTRFDSSSQSLSYLSNLLQDSLTANFGLETFTNDTLSFIVLSNGEITQVTYSGKNDQKKYLEKILLSYNQQWQPAKTMSQNVYRMRRSGDFVNQMMAVNYRVSFIFKP